MKHYFKIKRALLFLTEVMGISVTVFAIFWGINADVIRQYNRNDFESLDPLNYVSGVVDFADEQIKMSHNQGFAQVIDLSFDELLTNELESDTSYYLFVIDRTKSTADDPIRKKELTKIKKSLVDDLVNTFQLGKTDRKNLMKYDASDLIAFYCTSKLLKSEENIFFALAIYNDDDTRLEPVNFKRSIKYESIIDSLWVDSSPSILDILEKNISFKKPPRADTDFEVLLSDISSKYLSPMLKRLKTERFSNTNEPNPKIFIFSDFLHDTPNSLNAAVKEISNIANFGVKDVYLYKYSYLTGLGVTPENERIVQNLMLTFQDKFQTNFSDYENYDNDRIIENAAKGLGDFMNARKVEHGQPANLFFPSKLKKSEMATLGYFKFSTADAGMCSLNFKSIYGSGRTDDVKLAVRLHLDNNQVSTGDSLDVGTQTYITLNEIPNDAIGGTFNMEVNKASGISFDPAETIVEISLVNMSPLAYYHDLFLEVSHGDNNPKKIIRLGVKERLVKSHVQVSLLALYILFWSVSLIITLTILVEIYKIATLSKFRIAPRMLTVFRFFCHKIFFYNGLTFVVTLLVLSPLIYLGLCSLFNTELADMAFGKFDSLWHWVAALVFFRLLWLIYNENSYIIKPSGE